MLWNRLNVAARLAFANTKYLGATGGANALRRRPAILQRNGLGILNLNLFPALHAVCLSHFHTSLDILPSSVANPLVFVNTLSQVISGNL
jgi:hypothetical protein